MKLLFTVKNKSKNTTVLGFEEKSPFDSPLRTRDEQIYFCSHIFENARKKVIDVKNTILAVFGGFRGTYKSYSPPKMFKMVSITFFRAFSKIPSKRKFVHLLFLELNQSRNTPKTNFGGFFFKNQKRAFLGVQNSHLLSSNFRFVFLHLFFTVKGNFMPFFTKKIFIFEPLEFLKMKI